MAGRLSVQCEHKAGGRTAELELRQDEACNLLVRPRHGRNADDQPLCRCPGAPEEPSGAGSQAWHGARGKRARRAEWADLRRWAAGGEAQRPRWWRGRSADWCCLRAGPDSAPAGSPPPQLTAGPRPPAVPATWCREPGHCRAQPNSSLLATQAKGGKQGSRGGKRGAEGVREHAASSHTSEPRGPAPWRCSACRPTAWPDPGHPPPPGPGGRPAQPRPHRFSGSATQRRWVQRL